MGLQRAFCPTDDQTQLRILKESTTSHTQVEVEGIIETYDTHVVGALRDSEVLNSTIDAANKLFVHLLERPNR